jgi:hypothetical protein
MKRQAWLPALLIFFIAILGYTTVNGSSYGFRQTGSDCLIDAHNLGLIDYDTAADYSSRWFGIIIGVNIKADKETILREVSPDAIEAPDSSKIILETN